MPRTGTAGVGGSQDFQMSPMRLLSSAHSCAQLAQLSLEGLGSASNLLLLAGVGAGLVTSLLSGLMIDGGLRQTTIHGDLR